MFDLTIVISAINARAKLCVCGWSTRQIRLVTTKERAMEPINSFQLFWEETIVDFVDAFYRILVYTIDTYRHAPTTNPELYKKRSMAIFDRLNQRHSPLDLPKWAQRP